MKNLKRVLSLLLTVTMIMASFGTTAFAIGSSPSIDADGNSTGSTTGEFTWTLTDGGYDVDDVRATVNGSDQTIDFNSGVLALTGLEADTTYEFDIDVDLINTVQESFTIVESTDQEEVEGEKTDNSVTIYQGRITGRYYPSKGVGKPSYGSIIEALESMSKYKDTLVDFEIVDEDDHPVWQEFTLKVTYTTTTVVDVTTYEFDGTDYSSLEDAIDAGVESFDFDSNSRPVVDGLNITVEGTYETTVSDSTSFTTDIVDSGNDGDDDGDDDIVIVPSDTYSITFESNGGNPVSGIDDIEPESTVTLPTPTRNSEYENAEYEFLGWFTEGNESFTEEDTVDSNLTLYAVWDLPGTADIHITADDAFSLYVDGDHVDTKGTGGGDQQTYKTIFKYRADLDDGYVIAVKAEDLHGTIAGLYVEILLDDQDSSIKLSDSVWKQTNTEFDGWYNTGFKMDMDYWNDVKVITDTKYNITIPTTWNVRGAWGWTNNELGTAYFRYGKIKPLAPTTYTVTFDENYDEGSTTSIDVTYEETIKPLPIPNEKSGFTFDGWFEDPKDFTNEFEETTKVINDIIVYAKWIDTTDDTDNTDNTNDEDEEDPAPRNTIRRVTVSEIEIPDEEVAAAPIEPVVEEVVQVIEPIEEVIIEEVFLDDPIPEDVPDTHAQTSGIPLEAFSLIGVALTGIGAVLRKKNS